MDQSTIPFVVFSQTQAMLVEGNDNCSNDFANLALRQRHFLHTSTSLDNDYKENSVFTHCPKDTIKCFILRKNEVKQSLTE